MSGKYEFHDIAGIFHLLPDDELNKLADSIRANGLRHPIILYEGKVLDGRNRTLACEIAGVTPEYSEFKGTHEEAIAATWADNHDRRHLTSSQKAAAWVIKEEKLESVRRQVDGWKAEAAERIKAGKADPRQKIAQGGTKPDDRKTDAKIAKQAGTNRTYVAQAKKIKDERPAAFEAVHAGEKTLSEVNREIKEEKRQAKREEAARQIAEAPTIDAAVTAAKFTTLVVDPPWDWGDEGDKDQLGRGRTTYGEIGFDDLLAFPVGDKAASDAHIYLWITNRSLPKGFKLLDAWGFRYVTCLTWCKPSFGMGNYYRGSTEQVLFGVRGSLPLKRRDVGTWFEAPRGQDGHSSKPAEFYELVESCSPGPYLDVFSRRERRGWVCWGGQLG